MTPIEALLTDARGWYDRIPAQDVAICVLYDGAYQVHVTIRLAPDVWDETGWASCGPDVDGPCQQIRLALAWRRLADSREVAKAWEVAP